MDSTDKEADGGDSTLLVEYIMSGNNITHITHNWCLTKVPEQCSRTQKHKDRSVLSLLYQQITHQYCISFRLSV